MDLSSRQRKQARSGRKYIQTFGQPVFAAQYNTDPLFYGLIDPHCQYDWEVVLIGVRGGCVERGGGK